MVEMWPLAPNWREPFHAVYDFKTDIFTSRSGREQRRALRRNSRVTLKFTVTREGADTAKLERFLIVNQKKQVRMPDLSRSVAITSVSMSGTEITVDRDADWITAGAFLAIGSTLYTILNYDPTTLVVALDSAVPTNDRRASPVLAGLLDARLDSALYTSRAIEVPVNFAASPGAGPDDDDGSPDEVFDGREVVPFNPNFAQAVPISFVQPVDQVDFGLGRTSTYAPIAFNSRAYQFSLMLPDPETRDRLIRQFCRARGQQGEFYLPEPARTLRAASTRAADTSALVLAGLLPFEIYQADDVHRAISLTSATGKTYYRKLSDPSTDGVNSIFSVYPTLPFTVDETTSIAWLLASRYATDQLDVSCVTSAAATTQVSVTSLEDLPVVGIDRALNGIDDGAEYLVDNFTLQYLINGLCDPLDTVVNYTYPFIQFGYANELDYIVNVTYSHITRGI